MNHRHTLLLLFLVLAHLSVAQKKTTKAAVTFDYEIVIRNGRVMDPETGLDAIRNVGIKGGRIAEISTRELSGKEVIDATGHVVAPGFIDLHAHGQTNKENEYQAHDGVTTALELEGGVPEIGKWIDSRRGKAVLNYGGSVSHPWARSVVIVKASGGGELTDVLANKANYLPLKMEDTGAVNDIMDQELYGGALGIGVPIGYYPGATREEVYNVYEYTASRKMIVYTHVREGRALAIQQAIADAVTNGTSLHIVHINSMAMNEIVLATRMVQHAQARGLDVTTEMYPYTAGSTSLESAIFDEGWQTRLGISYGDLQWVETGERLTEETFKTYRQKGGVIILHSMKPEWIEAGIKSPVTMIGSDGMPYSRLAHPRSAGTFTRVLGVYVRERKALTLMEGLSKMTIMPAKRLEPFAPMMRAKGRIQVGTDADITVFDPNTVIDKATFEGGLKFAEGIKHVMVNGVFVVKNGATVGEVYPGVAIVGKLKR